MSSVPPFQKSGSLRRKRYKATIACTVCRKRKLKCDGLRPACGRCQKKEDLRETCSYTPARSGYRGHTLENTASSSHHLPTTIGHADLGIAESDGPEAQGDLAEHHPGEFACKVKQVIDARLGLPAARHQCPTPMLDAPLFGWLFQRRKGDSGVDNVLPPRNHADHLVSLYWRYIDPLDHLIDQEHFSRSYQTLFTGGEHDYDESLFVSTLNIIFALSTQLQETVPSEQRDEESNAFFQRAWNLLRPETVIWGPGSLELIQCLLLMSRYLQCTKNPHQTWMAVGSAVRIAQSLGLHMPDKSSSHPLHRDHSLRQRVWQRCVFLDRCLSWPLRRSSMVPVTVLSPSINSLHSNKGLTNNFDETIELYSIKMMELNEITGLIMLSQVPTRSKFAESLDLPHLYRNADLNASMQIDECLNKWENSLPVSAQLGPVQDDPEDSLGRRRLLLRLQLAHTRVLLFRPMLTRFCLSEFQGRRILAPVEQGLEDRILRECATICVQNSQKMIALIDENSRLDESIGILPWWYRVFYLYIASQLLVAAMLRPDTFKPMVLDSWSKAMSALGAHEHLSSAVQRGVAALKTMWQKVADIHCPGGDQAPAEEGFPNTAFQDIFQDLRFEAGNPFLGMEDVSLMDNIDWSR